ncbi:hypothetical protein [Butyrivibrio sp.]|uniref:hypothetical protein n=1 Tax=Butyrivibrio sp. TaxID=28121 RepID=UPI0025C68C5C|nr:hypothetical protein [Butyrivibrio sp.]MBQ7431376.1 hypothetical protein [Butyrivibrio sp.]MBQ9302684.1 hypothetical protein [Butyrivibrio sp.]
MTKDEFILALQNEGYSAGVANNGIPTVFVTDASMISSVRSSLKQLIKQNGYCESYGIALTTGQ